MKMFQVHVAGALHEHRGIIRRGQELIDRDLVRHSGLRQCQAGTPSFEYPQLQQCADPAQGARRVALVQRRRA